MSDSQCNQDEEERSESQLQTQRTRVVNKFVSMIDKPTDWNENYDALSHAKKKDLYLGLLKKIEENAKANDIDSLKVFIKVVRLVNKTERNKVLLETFSDNDDNPFKSSNLILLACKHNQIEVLKYLFAEEMEDLNNLLSDIGCNKMGIFEADKGGRTAFYYAIRSNNVDLIETLLKLENPPHDFDNILSKDYQELKLQNIEIAEKVQIYVQYRLIRGCFYRCILDANNKAMPGIKNADDNCPDCIHQRLNVLVMAANDFIEYTEDDISADINECIARFIAQNIRVLKQQLESTYTQLPWEEMEFYLSRFSFLCSIQRENLQGHLSEFVKKLEDIFGYGNDGDDDTENVKNNITKYMKMTKPKNRKKLLGFESLYIDYELMKDEYSLKKILRYIKLALSVNPEEQSGRAIIQRALHVIGEYVKDSPRSPHLSEMIRGTLIQEKLGAMIDVAPSLRDALSHSDKLHALFWRNKIFNEDRFFTKIQSDLTKIEYVFLQVTYNVKFKQIEKWIEDIRKCKIKDIKVYFELNESLKNIEFVDVEKRQVDVLNNIEKLVTHVREIVVPMTDRECEVLSKICTLFTEIESIIKRERCKIADSTVDFNTLLTNTINHLVCIQLDVMNETTEQNNGRISKKNVERGLKNVLGLFHFTFTPKSEELLKIVSIIELISDNTKEHTEFKKIQALLDEIVLTIVLESSLSKAIEAFKEKLDTSEIENFGQDETTKTELDDIFSTFMDDMSEEMSKKLESSLEKLKSINGIASKLNRDIEYKLSKEELKFLNNELRAKKARGKKLLEVTVDYYGEFLVGKREFNKFVGSLRLKTKEERSRIIAVFKEEEGQYGDDIESRLKKTIDRSKQQLTDSQHKNLVENLKIRVRDHEARNSLNRFFGSDEDMTEDQYKKLVDCVDTTDAVRKELIKLYSYLNTASIASSLDDPYGALLKVIGTRESTAIEICNSFVNLVKSLDLDEDSKELLSKRIIGDKVFKTLEDCFHENLKLLTSALGSVETPESQNDLILRYKHEENLQAEVEMLLFNLCIISSTIDSLLSKFMAKTSHIPLQCMEKGFLQLDGDVHFLRGDALRNYLAHGDSLIDSLFFDSTTAVISSAILFSQESESLISLNNLVKNSEVKEILMKQVGANVPQLNPKVLPSDLKQHKETLTNFYKSRYSKDYLINIFTEPKTKKKLRNIGIFDVDSPFCRLVLSVLKRIQLFDVAIQGSSEELQNQLCRTTDIYARDCNNRTMLHNAAGIGHEDIVQILLDIGIKVEAVDKWGQTPLHLAASNGRHLVVEKLLKHGAQVDAVDIDKKTPLHKAAVNGCTAVVITLLKFGANVYAERDDNCIPIHDAAMAGHFDVIKLLVEENPASCNIQDTKGLKPLHYAAMGENDNVEVVEYLIKTGELGVEPTDIEDTPLYIAAVMGNDNVFKVLFNKEVRNKDKNILLVATGKEEIVRILLDNDANVDAVNNDGYTALHFAALRGHNRVISCLLKRGAKVGIPDKDGMVPLHCAATNGHLVAVKSLVRKGKSDINARDNNDRTPLHIAAIFNNLKVIKFLLKRKACVNARTRYDETPLQLCICSKYCDLKVVTYLAKKKADLNVQTSFGWTLLHSAVITGDLNIVKCLIDMNASAYTPDNHGQTALHYAAFLGHLDVVKFLLDKTNIDATSDDKCTALHEAIMFGHDKVVRCLLDKGANIEAVDKTNNNVIHLAAIRGRLNVLQTLLDYKHDVKFIDACNMNQETPLCISAFGGYSGIEKTC